VNRSAIGLWISRDLGEEMNWLLELAEHLNGKYELLLLHGLKTSGR
jgi:hypothetical protein